VHSNGALHSSLALGLAALASASGCSQRVDDQEGGVGETAPGQVALTAAHDGMTVSVAPDKLLTVKLPSRPSTGYVWEVEEVDRSVLRPLDEAHEQADELIGGEATHVRRFTPVRRGSTRLSLVYRRPWQKDAPPMKTYSVSVDVQGAYAGPAPTPLFTPAAQVEQGPSAEAAAGELPSRYDFCQSVGCTPIKDQGQCGSCWAFATVGVVEQIIWQKDGQPRDISEQYLVSCNRNGWGCDGGWVAFDLFIDSIPAGELGAGAVYEADFPYDASELGCNPPHQHQEKLVSYAPLGSAAVTDIKNAILVHGPVWTAVCADSSFSYYRSGVFGGSGCTSINHGIVLVGWDDGDGQGYWIVRNSWGAGWGEAGYMRIRWGANAIGSRDHNYYASYAGGGSCTPTTCAAQGKDCGSIPDGCGGTLECGNCPDGQTCGGGGVTNVCGGGQACWTPYARSSCNSYRTGSKVSAAGHNFICASRACRYCSWFTSCAPGAIGCPWGSVWTDEGACR